MFITLLAFIAAIALLVFVHEMGHYLAARWCGVKVLQFSIGFGPSLFEKVVGPDRTRWTIAAVPLGGFVKMLDEENVGPNGDPPIATSERHRAFNQQSLLKRSAIVVAGPLANFLFAILAYATLQWSGVVEPSPQLAQPVAGSVAAVAGIDRGDLVLSADGNQVKSWNSLRLEVLEAAIDRRPVRLILSAAGSEREVEIPTDQLEPGQLEGDFLRVLGLEMDGGPVTVGSVEAGGRADVAGLRTGDVVLSVNDQSIDRVSQLIQVIRSAPNKELAFKIERSTSVLNLVVTPAPATSQDGAKVTGRIGAALGQKPFLQPMDNGVLSGISRGVEQTWNMSVFSLRMLGKMIMGDLSWRNLSGPITIADYAGKTAKIGWEAYLSLLALISVSLGVLNLLPIPVLDGGHLVYYGLEAIRGRPLSRRIMDWTRTVGVGLIGLMMIVAISNDILRKLG